MNSFEDHDARKLAKAVNQPENVEPDLQPAISTDFMGLRKSGTVNFAVLLDVAKSQDLQDATFNEPPVMPAEASLGKRDRLETATPPKSAKKSRGKSRGNSAKSSKAKTKNKSPNANGHQSEADLRKQFSFGDLSLALTSAGENTLNRAPSLADLGISVKLEGTLDADQRLQDKMNLRSNSASKSGP